MLNKVIFPKRWNENLAYLFGLLLGDGSLPITSSRRLNGKFQKRYHVYFISNSADFCDKVYLPLFTELFGIKPRKELVKNKLNPLYNCRIESKLIYQFLENRGYIVGRKAKIAKIPQLPQKYYVHLLAGLLDTDGGKKGNGFGLSTASEHLASFCIETFKKLKIPFTSCPWHYNNHVYHQIYATKRNMQKILKGVPLRNLDKINFINSYSPQ